MTNFIERVKNFWEWFSENEEKLSEFAQNHQPDAEFSEQVVAFVNKGTALLGENLHFNMGGNHEFTFAVSGNHALFFLLPYVTASLPERFRDKWTFFPCMLGTLSQNFTFRMHGAMTDSDHVMVSAVQNDSGKAADLRFYAEAWEKLAEKDCYGAFYILMELCAGEALAASCVREVKRAEEPEDGMFPLTRLQEWLLDNLCENKTAPDPAESYHAYRYEPRESTEPRFDVIVGSTRCMPLINDYYAGDDYFYNTLTSYGAAPIFLSFCYGDEEARQQAFEQRNTLMDALEAEVLGERGSGREIGIMLGGAMGRFHAYIDLLLFDEQAFFEKARSLLDAHPLPFSREGFVRRVKEQPSAR